MAVFVAVERHVSHPLLPMRVLLNRFRAGAFLAITLMFVAMFGFYLHLIKGPRHDGVPRRILGEDGTRLRALLAELPTRRVLASLRHRLPPFPPSLSSFIVHGR